jgi:hypothetical protein
MGVRKPSSLYPALARGAVGVGFSTMNLQQW